MDNGKNGSWIGAGIAAAAAVYVTGSPWFILFILFALLAY